MDSYLKGIRESDPKILKEIYNEFFPILNNFINKNSGTEEDARDCFQEALMATFRRVKRADFEIKTTFSTYIFNVGKYIWFRKLGKKKLTVPVEELNFEIREQVELDINEEKKYLLLKKGLETLSHDCQTLLKYYFSRKKFKEIAELMNYSVDYARRKKLLCSRTLMKNIKSNPTYKEYFL